MPGKCVESLIVCNTDVLNAGSPLGHNKECEGEEGSRVLCMFSMACETQVKILKAGFIKPCPQQKKKQQHPNAFLGEALTRYRI